VTALPQRTSTSSVELQANDVSHAPNPNSDIDLSKLSKPHIQSGNTRNENIKFSKQKKGKALKKIH